MSKTLVSDVLAGLDAAVTPADSTQTIPWLNRVLEKMIAGGQWGNTTVKWKGVETAASFNVQQDANGFRFFTLPRTLLSVLGGGHGVTGGTDNFLCRFDCHPIRGPWFEFGTGRRGIGDYAAGSGIQDAGDGWTTFADILTPSYLRVVTATAELAGTTMLFQGLDQNQNEIFTGTGINMYRGVKLNISTGLTTQTTQQFSAAPTVVQKPVTYGPVNLYAVSVATGVATLIAIYDPGETAPGYRRYRLAGAWRGPFPVGSTNSTTVHVMAKRRFVPVVTGSDEVIPGNITALEYGFQARRYDLQNDPKTAASYWQQTFALLNADLGEHNGGAAPTLIFQRDSGLANICRVS